MNQNPAGNQMKFVTGNRNKLKEAQMILGVALDQANVAIEEIQTCDVEEAVGHKVRAAFEKVRQPVMVEDSGLVFEAWNGLPGALVKWFEKTVGLEGMARMLDSFDSRKAVAQCFVAITDGKETFIGRGEVRGRIAASPRGSNGFGWDTLFIPQGDERTFAEMTPEEKNAISHRRRAFEAVRGSGARFFQA